MNARACGESALPNPDVADVAPDGDELTAYDKEHAVTYVRMLDAEATKPDWREVTKIVLHIDPKATCRERNGFRERAIGNFCDEAQTGSYKVSDPNSEWTKPLR
jgi:hypothetical protein